MNERVAQEVVVLAQTQTQTRMTVHAGVPALAPELVGSSNDTSTTVEVSDDGPTVVGTTVLVRWAEIVPAHETWRPTPEGRCSPIPTTVASP